jgi:putative flippase GtrA
VIGAFGRFAIVGGLGFVVDSGGTALLVAAGVSPFVARIPAILAAMLTTWLLNRRLTFNVRRPKSTAELARYIAVASTSSVLNYLLYSVLVTMHLPPVVAVALATAPLVAASFFAYRHLVFE